MGVTMLKLTGIKKSFGKKDAKVEALKGVDIEISEGEMVAIMGKSGSGKSTLLNICGALMKPDQGTYEFRGKALDMEKQSVLTKLRRDHIGFVVQYFALMEDSNVFENVALPLRYQKRTRKVIREEVRETLKILEIAEKERAFPEELSGGQQQRVAIARAIVKDPELILADEPTGALDEATEESVMEVFDRIHQMGKTLIIVTHDEKVAKRCDRTIYLRDGRVADEREI